jgi:branched-chain amino acid transport system substrate-binding protein
VSGTRARFGATAERRWWFLVVTLCLAVAAAGCGDDDSQENSNETTRTGDTTVGTGPAGDTTGGTGPASETTRSSDTTGATGATDEVVKVGLVNLEGGTLSLPEFRYGAETAIGLINDQGGIDGKAIEVVQCLTDGSPEGSINCANTMVEEGVVLAYTGVDLASDAALPVLSEAGIPYVTSNGWGQAQLSDPNAFILHAASSAFVVAPLVTISDEGGESLAFVYEESAPAQARADLVSELARDRFDLEVTPIAVDPANADWATAVATAEAADVDAIWGQLSEPGCIGLTTSTTATGFDGLVFAGSCSAYISVVGDAAVGTYTQADFWPPDAVDAPPEIQARIDEFVTAMTAADHEEQIGAFAAASYSAWFDLVPILESIDGDITPDAIRMALSRGVASPGWLGPELECGAAPWPSEPSACSASTAVFRIVKDDSGALVRMLVTPFENRYALTQ